MNINKTELSTTNQNILVEYGQQIYKNHLYPSELKSHENKGLWMMIKSWLPSSFSAGSNLGYAVSLTHGADASNWLISKVAHRVIPISSNPEPQTWSKWIKCKITGFEEASVEETAKLLLTPKVLPLITMVSTNAGGLSFMAAAALIGVLYDRVLKDPKTTFTPDQLPELDELIKMTEENKLVDANGNQLTEQDIKDFAGMVNRYDLTYKLLNAKREDIEGVIASYMQGKDAFSDGSPISEAAKKTIAVAAERLKSQNICVLKEDIIEAINLLADHEKGDLANYGELRDKMLLKDWRLIDSKQLEAAYEEHQKKIEILDKAS